MAVFIVSFLAMFLGKSHRVKCQLLRVPSEDWTFHIASWSFRLNIHATRTFFISMVLLSCTYCSNQVFFGNMDIFTCYDNIFHFPSSRFVTELMKVVEESEPFPLRSIIFMLCYSLISLTFRVFLLTIPSLSFVNMLEHLLFSLQISIIRTFLPWTMSIPISFTFLNSLSVSPGIRSAFHFQASSDTAWKPIA